MLETVRVRRAHDKELDVLERIDVCLQHLRQDVHHRVRRLVVNVPGERDSGELLLCVGGKLRQRLDDRPLALRLVEIAAERRLLRRHADRPPPVWRLLHAPVPLEPTRVVAKHPDERNRERREVVRLD